MSKHESKMLSDSDVHRLFCELAHPLSSRFHNFGPPIGRSDRSETAPAKIHYLGAKARLAETD